MGVKGVEGEHFLGKTPRGESWSATCPTGRSASRIVATFASRKGMAWFRTPFHDPDAQSLYRVTIEQRGGLAPGASISIATDWAFPPCGNLPSEQAPRVPMGAVTVSLIGVSVALWLLMRFQVGAGVDRPFLYIAGGEGFLPEVKRGEILAALFADAPSLQFFAHFVQYDVPDAIWKYSGEFDGQRVAFIGFVLLSSSLLSNFFQYLESGPLFGGMSGVIFAQIGFLWCYKKCVPDFPHGLPKDVVVAASIWFLLCLTGIFLL